MFNNFNVVVEQFSCCSNVPIVKNHQSTLSSCFVQLSLVFKYTKYDITSYVLLSASKWAPVSHKQNINNSFDLVSSEPNSSTTKINPMIRNVSLINLYYIEPFKDITITQRCLDNTVSHAAWKVAAVMVLCSVSHKSDSYLGHLVACVHSLLASAGQSRSLVTDYDCQSCELCPSVMPHGICEKG